MAGENPDGFTGVGTYAEISNTVPTALTAEGFASVSDWKEVGGTDDISEISSTRNLNTRTPLKTGVEVVSAGSLSYDPFTINGALIRGDEGLAALEAAHRSGALVSFAIRYGDGGSEYGRGIVTKAGRTPGDANSFVGGSYEIKPSGSTIIVEPT